MRARPPYPASPRRRARGPRGPRHSHRPRRPGPGLRLARVLFAGFLGLILLPPVVDAANGALKPGEGCRVVAIIDGDTLRIWCHDGLYRARVLAYDTPELSARCTSELVKAIAATWYLRWQLWRAGRITVKIDGVDRYGRKLVLLLTDGENVARRMVGAGLARWYDGGRRPGWCAPAAPAAKAAAFRAPALPATRFPVPLHAVSAPLVPFLLPQIPPGARGQAAPALSPPGQAAPASAAARQHERRAAG